MRGFLQPVAWFAGLLLLALPVRAAELSVVNVAPARHTPAPRTTAVAVVFDRAVDPAGVDSGSVRVFGRWSGPAPGELAFSADGKPKAGAKGKGAALGLADFSALNEPADAQLQRADGGLCLGATFSAPFDKQDASRFKARSD